jgi:hypothetical protein
LLGGRFAEIILETFDLNTIDSRNLGNWIRNKESWEFDRNLLRSELEKKLAKSQLKKKAKLKNVPNIVHKQSKIVAKEC